MEEKAQKEENQVAADPIWWSLDMFLADVIAHHLRDYIKHADTVPLEMDKEAWDKKLDSIAIRLEAYKNRLTVANPEAELYLTEQARAAMHDLADIFPKLWD